VKLHPPTGRSTLIIMLFGVTVHCLIASKNESHAQSVEELQQQIARRDAIILDLVERVEALEGRLPRGGAADQRSKETGQPTVPDDVSRPSDEETSRALERTLVREGGLVLPTASIEIEPRYFYTYRGSDALQIVTLNGQQVVARQDVQRDRSDSSLNLRIGLPWTSQIDFRVPFILDWQDTATAASERSKRKRSGLGDIELGWTKQLISERGWLPDLLTLLNWKSKTGEANIGSGFHGIEGGLTAVKRRDPLAFFGTVSHNWSLSGKQAGNDVDLGNTVGLRLGTILATSPDTSLRFALEMNRSARAEINSQKIPGSDSVIGLFEFGLATIVFPRTLLDFTVGMGLTSDSPDFTLGVSLPISCMNPLLGSC
jgi:hypothetical protein